MTDLPGDAFESPKDLYDAYNALASEQDQLKEALKREKATSKRWAKRMRLMEDRNRLMQLITNISDSDELVKIRNYLAATKQGQYWLDE